MFTQTQHQQDYCEESSSRESSENSCSYAKIINKNEPQVANKTHCQDSSARLNSLANIITPRVCYSTPKQTNQNRTSYFKAVPSNSLISGTTSENIQLLNKSTPTSSLTSTIVTNANSNIPSNKYTNFSFPTSTLQNSQPDKNLAKKNPVVKDKDFSAHLTNVIGMYASSLQSSDSPRLQKQSFRKTYIQVPDPTSINTSPAFEYILKSDQRKRKRCLLWLIYFVLMTICVSLLAVSVTKLFKATFKCGVVALYSCDDIKIVENQSLLTT